MKRASGFTLVELLVVIAIITILAGIVVPKVIQYIEKGKAAAAATEIRNIETALTDMLTSTGRKNFYQFFDSATVTTLKSADEIYHHEEIFYELLRRGNQADVPGLLPEVKAKLGPGYMDVPKDPWDNLYRFSMGPWDTAGGRNSSIPFRAWRANPDYDEDIDVDYPPYVYDQEAKDRADAEDRPGNPPADDLQGYPADRQTIVFVWSQGSNLLSDQIFDDEEEDPSSADGRMFEDFEYKGGGDDIPNWDTEQAWTRWY
ncbi:MAG: type II secretion system protein [bacterium]|nr:type II secretion system protein [bacterium]